MRIAWILHIYIYTVSEVYANECLYVNGSASHSHSYPLPRLQKPRTTGATASSEQQLPFKPWMATMSTHCDPPTLINENWWRWTKTTATKTAGGLPPTWSPNQKKGITLQYHNLGLFKVMFYFPYGKSTIWGIYSEYFLFFGNPLSKSKISETTVMMAISAWESDHKKWWLPGELSDTMRCVFVCHYVVTLR